MSYVGSEKAAAAVEEAEVASDHVCEICGEPGVNRQGLRTRCSEHEGIGSGNFLRDRGYPDPDETRTKFLLLNEIALDLDQRQLPLVEVGELTGVRFSPIDAHWSAGMLKKDIGELEVIRDRIRKLPLPDR